jgi:hypothetical protein
MIELTKREFQLRDGLLLLPKKAVLPSKGAKGGSKLAAKTFLNIALTILFFLTAFTVTIHAGTIYVDDDADGANDGSSWADAYNFLQDALIDANSSPKPVEIHVAQGIYKPDQGAGITPGDREATFQLINGVTLKGGFAGLGQPDPNARDVEIHETILTGDLASDDGPDFANNDENSYHVAVGSETDSTAVLDGFTLTGGNANIDGELDFVNNGEDIQYVVIGDENNACAVLEGLVLADGEDDWHDPRRRGGGMYSYKGSPVLINCIFRENWARRGGGMFNDDSSNPTLTDCQFIGNYANSTGGGMYNDYYCEPTVTGCTFNSNMSKFNCAGMFNIFSKPTVINCTFSANMGGNDGGGMYNLHSHPTVTNCKFNGNSAKYGGGGMHNGVGHPIVLNCTFIGNSAKSGGGICNHNSVPKLTNCKFSTNSADYGGGMSNHTSAPTLLNCIFSWNTSIYGGGLNNNGESFPKLTNCTFAANSATNGNALACYDYHNYISPSVLQVSNCILWDGGDEIWNNDGSTIAITYSDVGSGWPGEGNIDVDPCFVEPGYWDANGAWIDGDYHLLPDSPCIDAGDPNYIPELNETDLDGKPRVINCRVDMGTYEYDQLVPAEVRIVPRTINLSSKGNWITSYIWLPEKYDISDIDPNSILLECEIEPWSLHVDEQERVLIARFSRQEARAILEVGDINLTITGRLTNDTVFEATDTIKVIDKAGKK